MYMLEKLKAHFISSFISCKKSYLKYEFDGESDYTIKTNLCTNVTNSKLKQKNKTLDICVHHHGVYHVKKSAWKLTVNNFICIFIGK